MRPRRWPRLLCDVYAATTRGRRWFTGLNCFMRRPRGSARLGINIIRSGTEGLADMANAIVMTTAGSGDRSEIWPRANRIGFALVRCALVTASLAVLLADAVLAGAHVRDPHQMH